MAAEAQTAPMLPIAMFFTLGLMSPTLIGALATDPTEQSS
jgi:hypothetical protein